MAKSRSSVIDSFRRALAKPVELDVLLAKAGQKDRNNVEKFLATLDAESGTTHGALWRRLTRALGTLAPLAITTVGQQAVQFFIADGKYRMQVFALEDQQDGQVIVYIPDVLGEATKLKIVVRDGGDNGPAEVYQIPSAKGQILHIEQMTGPNTPNPSPHYKNMLGWNRKALKIPVPVSATDEQVEAIETLAALAAGAWADKKPREEA
jgi:hypothetical protein